MRNMHRVLLILLCAHLSACAGLPQPAGKDAGNPAFEERIATDTVNQIARLYPPARTQLNVVSTPDSFGALLAAKLRGRGFGVAETIEAKPKVLPFAFHDDFRMSAGRPGGSGQQIPARCTGTRAALSTRRGAGGYGSQGGPGRFLVAHHGEDRQRGAGARLSLG